MHRGFTSLLFYPPIDDHWDDDETDETGWFSYRTGNSGWDEETFTFYRNDILRKVSESVWFSK